MDLIGNVRIDAVTIGSNGKFEKDSVFVVAIVRGQYSPAKFKTASKLQPGTIVRAINGIDVISHEEGMLIMLSNRVVIMVYGAKTHRTAMIDAVKKGKGTLADDNDMAALINTVNRESGGWAAVLLNKQMKAQHWLAPYHAMTAYRSTGDNGRPTMNILAMGKDAQAVKKTSMRFAADIKIVEQFAIQMAQQGQLPKPLLEMLQSIKVDLEGPNAKVTFFSPKGMDTIMTTLAFFPIFALLGGEDILNF